MAQHVGSALTILAGSGEMAVWEVVLEEHFSASCSRVLHAPAPAGMGPGCPSALMTQGQILPTAGGFCPGKHSLCSEDTSEAASVSGLLAHLLNFQVPGAIVSASYVYIPSDLNLCLAKVQVGKLIHSFMSR